MTNQELEKLKYPIGKFNCPKTINNQHIKEWISVLEHFPERLNNLVKNLNNNQLDTRYRPNGWTIRQVIHHLSDSHHNSYIRFKWAITEDNPIIKAYDENAWASQNDYSFPIKNSLLHLKIVHIKLVGFVKGLNSESLERTFIHPESNETVSLKKNIGIYAWHSNHHYAHIKTLMDKNNWI